MSAIAVVAVMSGPAALARDTRLDTLLHAVEQRYNRAKTLSLRFTETYFAGKRPKRTESGTLELKKPGKMRWDYASPPGKLFLSDGKNFFLYDPAAQRVEKTPLRASEDLRAPLAFLLGRLNFYKEFGGFEEKQEGNDLWIIAEPNSADLPYSKVEFLVGEDARIRRLRITGDDLSLLDFTFEDERLNPPLDSTRFVFRVPPGAEVVEADR